MNKILSWFKESNRWKHLTGGLIIGAFSDSLYCAIYSSFLTGAALEFKDQSYGGKCDWIDLLLTWGGGLAGWWIRRSLLAIP